MTTGSDDPAESARLEFRSGALRDADLTRPGFHSAGRHAAMWGLLRSDEPVAWHPAASRGFWVISRYVTARAVYRDAETFSSCRGNVLATLLSGGDSAGGRMLPVSDGARHHEIRRQLVRAFSTRAMAPLEARISAVTRRLISQAVERGSCDFAVDVAAHIPLAAICDLLGVPEPDRAPLLRHTSSALSSDSADGTDVESKLARNEILQYFSRFAKRHTRRNEDDLVELLLQMKDSPLALTEEEFLLNCYSLLLGGDETTRLAMISAVKALMEWPGEWSRLRSGEVSLDSAAEELLRWATPAMHGGRTATTDTELDGRHISVGDVVTVWNISANFDPEEFSRPDELDLARTPNRHLAFAYGPHACLGARLARIEMRALLQALTDEAAAMVPDGQARPVYSNFLTGCSSLPMRFVAGHDTNSTRRAAR